MRRLALYMFYDESGVVSDYVVHKLAKLREHVETIVVIVNGELSAEGQQRLESVADVVRCRANTGFDVWAYRDGLIDVIGWERLAEYDELLLLNYTFYAPIFPFAEMFEHMAGLDVDFWGITAFKGTIEGDGTVLPFHIQSHWIAVRKRMLQSEAFRQYWETMPPIAGYFDSIFKHEVRFTTYFSEQGFRFSVYVHPDRFNNPNPALNSVDGLVDERCPILKRRPFFHDPIYMDRHNVELGRALERVRQTSDYDLSLVWKDITRVTKPRDLYTNATLFEVLSDSGPAPALRDDLRIAVLAHVYFPELLHELVSYARNIPAPFDLFITTSDDAKRQAIVDELAALEEPRVRLREVRVVPNRGRDVGAHFIGLRDVVRAGTYDYVCRLHSKASPQDVYGARHFKEHLFENLLASPAYVAQLLALFEREPSLGMVMPPVIHIGYPTLGHAWFGNREPAQKWAKRLGIKVPFDDYTPVAAYGSMYWYRPRALRALFDHPFEWSDFPQEPDYRDGGLAHVLERLVAYACHQSGHYSKSVMTPRKAAESYVKLEYKLQKLIGDRTREGPQPVPSPLDQFREYASNSLSALPVAQKVFDTSWRLTSAGVRLARRMTLRAGS